MFNQLINGFTITSIEETMLGGNQFKKDSERLVWKESSEAHGKPIHEKSSVVDIENIMLHPMQIRTFILDFQKNV